MGQLQTQTKGWRERENNAVKQMETYCRPEYEEDMKRMNGKGGILVRRMRGCQVKDRKRVTRAERYVHKIKSL